MSAGSTIFDSIQIKTEERGRIYYRIARNAVFAGLPNANFLLESLKCAIPQGQYENIIIDGVDAVVSIAWGRKNKKNHKLTVRIKNYADVLPKSGLAFGCNFFKVLDMLMLLYLKAREKTENEDVLIKDVEFSVDDYMALQDIDFSKQNKYDTKQLLKKNLKLLAALRVDYEEKTPLLSGNRIIEAPANSFFDGDVVSIRFSQPFSRYLKEQKQKARYLQKLFQVTQQRKYAYIIGRALADTASPIALEKNRKNDSIPIERLLNICPTKPHADKDKVKVIWDTLEHLRDDCDIISSFHLETDDLGKGDPKSYECREDLRGKSYSYFCELRLRFELSGFPEFYT